MKGSFGPSSYAMCGRSFDPRFLFTWPTARVAMDAVDDMVSMCCAEQEVDGDEMTEEKRQSLKDKFVKKFEQESRGYYGTARLWDDGIILPQDTRKIRKRFKLVPGQFIFSLTHNIGYFPGRSWVRVYKQPYPHSPADKRASLVFSECNNFYRFTL